MSENLVIVSRVEEVKRRYNFKANELCGTVKTPSIVSGGDLAWVITSKEPTTLQTMRFGFTPHRSETRTDMLNTRTDEASIGDDDSDYDRLMGVFMKLDFWQSINAFRCVVMVDAFLVTLPDNIHYLIHMQNKERPFALAGLYDHWQDPKTKAYSTGFTIITVAANPMLSRMGVNQMPVVITLKNVLKWLDLKTDRRQYLSLIHTFPDEMMNGYAVSSKIFSGQLTTNHLQPIGSKLKPDKQG